MSATSRRHATQTRRHRLAIAPAARLLRYTDASPARHRRATTHHQGAGEAPTPRRIVAAPLLRAGVKPRHRLNVLNIRATAGRSGTAE